MVRTPWALNKHCSCKHGKENSGSKLEPMVALQAWPLPLTVVLLFEDDLSLPTPKLMRWGGMWPTGADLHIPCWSAWVQFLPPPPTSSLLLRKTLEGSVDDSSTWFPAIHKRAKALAFCLHSVSAHQRHLESVPIDGTDMCVCLLTKE